MWALLFGLSALGAQQRHALIIGANLGPASLEPLRYAEDDARRLADVLTQLGGFPADEVTVLYGPDVAEVQAALGRHATLARGAEDDLFVFYYSGHADNQGLRLGEETLPYTSLRRAVRDVPADVRVGVLDACRSGEITRIKGLSVSSPFAVDHSLSSEGEAWLTATTAEESAQESDTLKSSFFTHALVTGLRGAADRDDGVVSLAEAYAYAYDSTVARTGTTQNGTQHPAYDFRLQGRGDLPLTEVRRAEALVILPEEMAGQLHVLSAPDNALVAEIAKTQGLALTLGLPARRYTLRLRDGDRVQEARVGLSAGSTLRVRGLQPTELAAAAAKGPTEAPLALPVELSVDGTVVALPPEAPPIEEVAQAALAAPPVAAEPPSAPQGSRMLAGLDGKARGALERLDAGLEALLEPVDGAISARRSAPSAVAPSALTLTELAPGCAEADLGCLGPVAAEAGLPEGPVTLRLASGATAAEGALRAGRREGRWTFYYPDGTRLAEGAYRAGVRGGTWTWWSASGERLRRGSYERGQPDGLWTDFYPTGERRAQQGWDRGVPHGRAITWHDNGQRASEGSFRRGQAEGRWTTWHANGQRASRGEFHLGLKTGPWSTWHDNGQLQSEGRYVADLPDGRWSTFHDNGAPESRGRYADGQRTGLWRTWDANGDLIERARYRDGERVR